MASLGSDVLLNVYVALQFFGILSCSSISAKIQPVSKDSAVVESLLIRPYAETYKTAGNELSSRNSLVKTLISSTFASEPGEEQLNVNNKKYSGAIYFHRLGRSKTEFPKNYLDKNSVDLFEKDADGSSYEVHPRTARLAEADINGDSHEVSKMVLTIATTIAALFSTCMLVAIFQCCCRKKRSLQDDSDNEEKNGRSQSYRQTEGEANGKRPLLEDDDGDDEAKSVSDKIKAFEGKHDDPVLRDESARPARKIHGSEMFDKFEKEGIIMGIGRSPKKRMTDVEEVADHHDYQSNQNSPSMGYKLPVLPKSKDSEDQKKEKSSKSLSVEIVDDSLLPDDDFSAVKRETEILRSYRKAGPPAKRRAKKKANRTQEEEKSKLISSEEKDVIIDTQQTTVELHVTPVDDISITKNEEDTETRKSVISVDDSRQTVLSENKLDDSSTVLSDMESAPIKSLSNGSNRLSPSPSDNGDCRSVSRSDSGSSKSVSRSNSDSCKSVTHSEDSSTDVTLKQPDNDLTKHPNIFMQLDPTVQPGRLEARKTQSTNFTDDDSLRKKKPSPEKEDDVPESKL